LLPSIAAENDSLVIRPVRKPRAGWAAAFKKMAPRDDGSLLAEFPPSLSSWDEDEWQW